MSRAPSPQRFLLLLLLLAVPVHAAQVAPPEPEAGVVRIQTDFEYGKFADVLAQAEARLDRSGVSDATRLELHRLAGLSAFNMDRRDAAERHLRSALRLDPDLSLDPFRVPSPAITFLQRLREQMAGELESLRRDKLERQERARRETEQRALERSEVEVLRGRVEDLTRQVTVRTVEKRSLVLNFLPFGAGQFQQERTSLGVALAAGQGVLGAASVISYLVRGTLREPVEEKIYGLVGDDVLVRTVWRLPAGRERQDQRWAIAQTSTAIGFYGLFVFGVVDALLHHQDQVVRTSIEPLPPSTLPLGAGIDVTPIPGGAAASLSFRF